jgi:hypothetical protein
VLVPIIKEGFIPGMPIEFKNCWYDGFWSSVDEMKIIEKTIEDIISSPGFNGNKNKFFAMMNYKPLSFSRRISFNAGALAWPKPFSYVMGDIELNDNSFSKNNPKYPYYTIAHEIGHIWDFREGFQLSHKLGIKSGTLTLVCNPIQQVCSYEFNADNTNEIHPGDPTRIEGQYAKTNVFEEWAESFASYIYPLYWTRKPYYEELGPIRKAFVEKMINELP